MASGVFMAHSLFENAVAKAASESLSCKCLPFHFFRSILQAPLPENVLYPGVDAVTQQNGGLICLYGHRTSIKESKVVASRDCTYQGGGLFKNYTGFEVVVPIGGVVADPGTGEFRQRREITRMTGKRVKLLVR